MARITSVVFLAAALASVTGCTSALKQAYYEVRGAQADVVEMDESAPPSLAQYQSVVFEPATTQIGPKIAPPSVLAAYDTSARAEAEALKDAFPGGEPSLTVRTEILYSQNKGLMSGALGLARVRLSGSDGTTRDIVVKSESKSFRAGDKNNLAEAAVKAVGGYLRKHKGGEAKK